MKSPIYFEAFGTIGKTVSFVGKDAKTSEIRTTTMLLAECPDQMRIVVMHDHEFKTHGSYEKDKATGQYKKSDCPDRCCKHRLNNS